MKTRLLNYRSGFASNSSSTHSVYIVNDSRKIRDSVVDTFFGWDNFIASSRESMNKYVASQIKKSISRLVPEYVKNAVLRSIFHQTRTEDFDCYIDHQSDWLIPPYMNTSMDFPSIDLINDIRKHLFDNRHIILGGNDNDSDDPAEDLAEVHHCEIDPRFLEISNPKMDSSDCVCLKDGNVWKFFNLKTGEKIRFSFDDSVDSYDKSSVPELVDLIITNRCDCNCSYCYRDCTPDGSAANFGNVCDYIETLIGMNVFEIVIGGGDLLQYEYLDELMNVMEYHKIRNKKTVAFNTTLKLPSYFGYSPGWSKSITTKSNIDERKIERIFDVFSGVAFSISTAHEIYNLVKFLGGASASISIQCIPEVFQNPERFLEVVEVATKFNLNITLLGLKETGRARNNAFMIKTRDNMRNQIDKWFPKLSDYYYMIGVDTQFVNNFPQIYDDDHAWTITPEEGKFSCCIDATDNTISASSYHPDKTILVREESDIYNEKLKNQIEKIYKDF